MSGGTGGSVVIFVAGQDVFDFVDDVRHFGLVISLERLGYKTVF